MRKYVFCICFLFLLSCAQTIRMEELQHLNGYWQIEKVTFPDRSAKTYNFGSTVDFIKLEDTKGFRKKVQPALDGTFDTSDDAISIEVISRNEGVYLMYSNAAERWEELVLRIDDDGFAVRNEAGMVYEYKRYNPVIANDE